MRKPHLVLLLTALLLGTGLRINGIGWGLPDDIHTSYSYHPDEASLVGWAADLYRGTIVAKQFMYGGTFLFSSLQASSDLADAVAGDAGATLRDKIAMARYFSLCYAVLSILLTYLAGATLYSKSVGAWAALIMALAPGHVIAAQVARPDALFTLLLTLNLLYAARIARGIGKASWNLSVGGALLGLAVATRFPAGLWWFGYLLAMRMARDVSDSTHRTLGASALRLSLVGMVAYLVASPHSVIYFPALVDGLATQFSYQRGSAADAFTQEINAWRYGGDIMAHAIGYGFYLPALAALIYAATRRARADYLVAGFALPYFGLLLSTNWLVVRYFVPLLPLAAILLGRMLSAGLAAPASLVRATTVAVVISAVTVNALALVIYGAALHGPDLRDQALQWLLANVPPGTAIGVLQAYDGDVYFHPPAIAHFKWSACPLRSCDPAQFFASPVTVLVIADEYLDEVSTQGRRMSVAQALGEQSVFVPVRRFAPELVRFGYDVAMQFSASDLHHPLPALTVYRRR